MSSQSTQPGGQTCIPRSSSTKRHRYSCLSPHPHPTCLPVSNLSQLVIAWGPYPGCVDPIITPTEPCLSSGPTTLPSPLPSSTHLKVQFGREGMTGTWSSMVAVPGCNKRRDIRSHKSRVGRIINHRADSCLQFVCSTLHNK